MSYEWKCLRVKRQINEIKKAEYFNAHVYWTFEGNVSVFTFWGLMFVCLILCLGFYFWRLRPLTNIGERLNILTYTLHSWPLNSDGSLAFRFYCDRGHPFKMIISKDPWHSHLLPNVGGGAITTCFTAYVCRVWDSDTQPQWGDCFNRLRHRGGYEVLKPI